MANSLAFYVLTCQGLGFILIWNEEKTDNVWIGNGTAILLGIACNLAGRFC